MSHYSGQARMLMAVDCILFGFDGENLKLLLNKRSIKPKKGNWSLMGGFLEKNETLEKAAYRVLKDRTGLKNVYLEQLHAFSSVRRDPVERTISVAYFALIDINAYQQQLSNEFHAEWFPLKKLPKLIFDHQDMLKMASRQLRYKAALHPILFELLPSKFTIPQLLNLYEGIYECSFDKRNFSRKLLSTGLLIKQKDKDRLNSKKGAFYYRLDRKKYASSIGAFLHFVPNPDTLIR